MAKQKRGLISLADKRPDVALDWDYEKNDTTPDKIPYGANLKVYWKCHNCGYKWRTTVNSRSSNYTTTGCLKCSNKRKQELRRATLAKRSKLPKTLNSQLAKNLEKLSCSLLRCPDCGHVWEVNPDIIAPYTEIPCPNCSEDNKIAVNEKVTDNSDK